MGSSEALAAARREAAAAFGDDALLVERLIAPARHLELQLLADAHGTVLDLGERECSLQRRHQKVVEEAPSPTVDAALRAELAREGVALARACGYVGAGTVEFVAHAQDPASHYFLEMNTRLQVEHAVTEAVRGVDLVEWQLRIAAGERLADADAFAHVRGHAVEARVYAEDPAAGFLPAAGTVRALRLPRGAGIRVESGVAAGETVGTRYDPLLAKVIAHGSTRAEALARLRGALRETAVLGVRTNVGFLRELLGDPHVLAGELDTGLVERTPIGATPPLPAARAALVALVAQALERRRRDPAREDPFARLGGWRVAGAPAAVPQQLRVDGSLEVAVALASPPAGVGGAPGEALLDGRSVSLALLGDQPCGGGRLLQRRHRRDRQPLGRGARRRALVGRRGRRQLADRAARTRARRGARRPRRRARADAGGGRGRAHAGGRGGPAGGGPAGDGVDEDGAPDHGPARRPRRGAARQRRGPGRTRCRARVA